MRAARQQRADLLGDDGNGENQDPGEDAAEGQVDRQRAGPTRDPQTAQPFDARPDRHPQRDADEQDEQGRGKSVDQGEADDHAQHHQIGHKDAAGGPWLRRWRRPGKRAGRGSSA